jgi:hypothetical protein
MMQSILASDQIVGHSIAEFEQCAPVDWRDAAQPPAPPTDQEIDRGLEIARSQDAMPNEETAA